MTPDKQRIAIAEACGWTRAKSKGFIMDGWTRADEDHRRFVVDSKMPDYVTSLDAMHEAEKTLREPQRTEYMNCLYDWAFATQGDSEWAQVTATATQRAEVFLRAIGKWEEDK